MLGREAGGTAEDTNRGAQATLPVCVDVPPSYSRRARYALTTLLEPLGLAPAWVARADISTSHALYYGPTQRAPEGVLSLSMSEDAAAFFERGPTELPEPCWVDAAGSRCPVMFTDGTGQPDLVASTFFWLSGWQEYVTRERDEHGRFTYAASLQRTLGIADLPVVDMYRRRIEDRLVEAAIPTVRQKWSGKHWAFCPTHDVDYIRKWRPGIIRREVERSLREVTRIAEVVRQLRRGDPFVASLHEMMDEVERVGGRSTWLLKAGGRDARDVPYSLDSNVLRRFIEQASARGFELGLHPSYHASTDAERLAAERDRLAAHLPYPPSSIRSHYLRFGLPETIRLYENAGFRIDSTLGFPDREGFRFGTCQPFRLFDVENDRETELWEVPLTFMDASLFNRRRLSVEEAIARTVMLLEACRTYGGVCVGLWHNVLADELDYPGWRRHFREVLRMAMEQDACISTLRDVLPPRAAGAQAPSAASFRTMSA